MPAVRFRGLPIATWVEWDLAESHDTSRLRRGRRTITATPCLHRSPRCFELIVTQLTNPVQS